MDIHLQRPAAQIQDQAFALFPVTSDLIFFCALQEIPELLLLVLELVQAKRSEVEDDDEVEVVIFVEHTGKRTFVVVLVLTDEELVIVLPILLEDLLEEIVVVELLEFLWNGLELAFVKSDKVEMREDAIELICLLAGDEAEGEGPEEAVAVSSYLPIGVQSRVQVLL